MTEEPYRWVEAIANRRDYIETELAAGSPIAAVGCADGIVLVTFGRRRQKLFEIYDRIAMGAIGHPGDIERLRMTAIELASTEGFTRSAADVSLRRLAFYSLSPVLKTAFEQIYGAPFLARMLFAELGKAPEDDLFLRVEYDGAIAMNGGPTADAQAGFGVISGTRASTELMEAFLAREQLASANLPRAVGLALDAWAIGKTASTPDATHEMPSADVIATVREEHLKAHSVEAVLLERRSNTAIRYRQLTEEEIRAAVQA